MSKAFLFKWGGDTFIMKANWSDASSPIMINGVHINENVGHFNHDPDMVARNIVEKRCTVDGLRIDDPKTQEMITKALKKMR